MSLLTWSPQLSTQAGYNRGLSDSKTFHPKGKIDRFPCTYMLSFYVILHDVCEIFYDVKQKMKRDATIRFIVNNEDTEFCGQLCHKATNLSVLFTVHLTLVNTMETA